MNPNKFVWAGVCLLLGTVAPAVQAQNQNHCAMGPDTAVQCFVSNAVQTNLVTLQYGMTMDQFKAYGVAVSKIIQAQPTALEVVGLASVAADALPPTNADGSANAAAQTAAVNSIVDAAVAYDFIILPAETNAQDVKWFSLGLVSAMNSNSGVLLSPGTILRVIDSYVVSATANGQVNWTQANAGIAAMMTNLSTAGMLKLPASITTAQAIKLAQAFAQITYTYRTATGKATL